MSLLLLFGGEAGPPPEPVEARAQAGVTGVIPRPRALVYPAHIRPPRQPVTIATLPQSIELVAGRFPRYVAIPDGEQ